MGNADARQLQSGQGQFLGTRSGSWTKFETRIPLSPGSRQYLVGRGEADAPDIDGRVYVRGKLPKGQFATVKIIGHTDYDLIAEPAASPISPGAQDCRLGGGAGLETHDTAGLKTCVLNCMRRLYQ